MHVLHKTQNLLPLDNLNIGEKGVIDKILAPQPEIRRFKGLGFIPGTTVQALHISPSGNPTAYSVMGAVIALRKKDANKIYIVKI